VPPRNPGRGRWRAARQLLDTARFEHLFRIAEAMSLAPLLPNHLRGDKQGVYSAAQIKGNCFRVVNQAVR
jgi:hypothetical protein